MNYITTLISLLKIQVKTENISLKAIFERITNAKKFVLQVILIMRVSVMTHS